MGWGAVAATVVGSMLADDNGAEAANNAAADANALQAQIARDQWNKYKEIYEPLERRMVDEAQTYATPENYAKAAGEASATVAQQFGKARDRLGRIPGLDPSSGAYASGLVGLDLAQAASDAIAQNAARQGVTDTAYARKQSALGLGKGLDMTASSGLANSAKLGLYQAQAAQAQANNQAGAIGRVADRIFSSKPVNDWLGNAFTPKSVGTAAGAANSYADNYFETATGY